MAMNGMDGMNDRHGLGLELEETRLNMMLARDNCVEMTLFGDGWEG
jgi:hypothetical protein